MAEPVRVTLTDLTNKVNEGWKKVALAEHYSLPVSQMTQLLKDAGLKIRKFHKPKYQLVDDTVLDANYEIDQGVDFEDTIEVLGTENLDEIEDLVEPETEVMFETTEQEEENDQATW